MSARNIKRLYDDSQREGVPITPRTADNTNGAIGGTAAIPPGILLAIVTSTDANQRVELPLNSVGTVLRIFEDTAVGYELICTTTGGIINGTVGDGVGANAEANIPADLMLECICVSATEWIVLPYNLLGQVAADITVG